MGQSTDHGGEVGMVHTGGWGHPGTPAGVLAVLHPPLGGGHNLPIKHL